MDSMVIVISSVAIVVLLIIALLLSGKNKQKKGKAKSKPQKSHKLSAEINPDAIVNRIFKLAPSELKKAKDEYIGKRVEIRTIFTGSKGSKKGGTYREVSLDFQDNRNIHIIGDLNMSDYKDQSWMTKEGKLRVEGTIKEMRPKEFILENIKII